MSDFNENGKQISNYTAYSDYEVNKKPQELLGPSVVELKEHQRKMFEGFKQSNERDENTPVKKFINEQQIQPLEKLEKDYIKKLNTINKNYNKLDSELNAITNNDKTGIRDKLMNDDKYGDYLSTELEQQKDVSDVRLDDTKDLIQYNNSIFNLGVVTAATLLVAGIVIARE